MPSTAVMTLEPVHAELVAGRKRDRLSAWFDLYMKLEGAANADETIKAKTRDLKTFLSYFETATGSDQADLWVRSITGDFLKGLQKARRSPTSINRMLATLRHAAAWIHRRRPFIAGSPCERLSDVATEDPEWKGLTDIEVTRLKAAAEQLVHLKTRQNQQPLRDYAIFHVLLRTALRITELLTLDLDQYQGKHFVNVKRKGNQVTREVFVAGEAREALDRYIDEMRGHEPGPLFLSRSGKRLKRQNADEALKAIAEQANARFPESERIELHAHVLRHTCLRKAAEKKGVTYAMQLSGHRNPRYIWRYVQPSKREQEAALDDLF